MTPSTGPLTVNHSGQLPSVTLSFNLEPGVSHRGRGDRVEQAAARGAALDRQHQLRRARPRRSSRRSSGLLALLVLAILVIYLVLGVLYESFVHPLTILSGLPFAGFGALLALLIFQLDLSVYAFVGIIMLIGIVKKNAIMMIDFAIEAERRRAQERRRRDPGGGQRAVPARS